MRSVNFLIGVSIALWAIYRVLLTGWRLTIRLAAAFQVSLMAVLFCYDDLVMNDAPWDFLSLETNGVC
jgi:hypothetical protein